MSDRRRQLDRLLGAYDEARQALERARALPPEGLEAEHLRAIDAAQERFNEAEIAYHEALYERAPGMSGDDRTAAAQQLAADTRARSEAYEREAAAINRVLDTSKDLEVDAIDEYGEAAQARRQLGLPDRSDVWGDLDRSPGETPTTDATSASSGDASRVGGHAGQMPACTNRLIDPGSDEVTKALCGDEGLLCEGCLAQEAAAQLAALGGLAAIEASLNARREALLHEY